MIVRLVRHVNKMTKDKHGDEDNELAEEFNDSMLKEWQLPEDESDTEDYNMNEDEDKAKEFSYSMLQEWQVPHDQSKDDYYDDSEDGGYGDIEEGGDDEDEIKNLKDELEEKEKYITDLKKKLENMTTRVADEYIRRKYLEEQVERAEDTIVKLLKVQELDKFREGRKEKVQEKDENKAKQNKRGRQDFINTLAMVRRMKKTVAGGIKKMMNKTMINLPEMQLMNQQKVVKQQRMKSKSSNMQMIQPMKHQMMMNKQKRMNHQMKINHQQMMQPVTMQPTNQMQSLIKQPAMTPQRMGSLHRLQTRQ